MAIDAPKLRLPSLKALQAFETAARHESFSRAAEELSVTPGAVAQQVKALEDWLGFPLFRRQSHGLQLLPQAKAALPGLVRAFDSLGDSVQDLRNAGPVRQIRIAALPCIAQLWLSPRLPQLRQHFPDLQISVTAMETPPNFRREPYDLALFYLNSDSGDPARLVLAQDYLFPVCSPALVKELELTEGLLEEQPLLADAVWAQDWPSWMKFAGLNPDKATISASFSLYSLALQTAIDGGGLLIGRETLVTNALQRKDVIAPFNIRLPSPRPLTLIMPAPLTEGHRLAELVEWFKTSVGT